jgi:hypothetical protein
MSMSSPHIDRLSTASEPASLFSSCGVEILGRLLDRIKLSQIRVVNCHLTRPAESDSGPVTHSR